MDNRPQYKRVLLKLSGEVLEGDKEFGIDFKVVEDLCAEIAEIHRSNVQIALVIGGGNFWRYRDFQDSSLDRVRSDAMGMMATNMNALILENELKRINIPVSVFSALSVGSYVQMYQQSEAFKKLQDGEIVICAGGTGNPFFTTDSAASLRALELECDVLLKATKVDYVYDKDPMKYPDAQKFVNISYQEVLSRELQVMDLTAISLCMSKKMPILVFNLSKKGNMLRAVQGESIGTLIS